MVTGSPQMRGMKAAFRIRESSAESGPEAARSERGQPVGWQWTPSGLAISASDSYSSALLKTLPGACRSSEPSKR